MRHARACVERLLRADSATPFEVVIVDDGSQADVRVWLHELARRRGDRQLYFLSFDANRGFAAAVNAGASVARGSTLCLLNSDTLVTHGWLDRLMAALDAHPSLGLAGPVTNMAGNLAQVDPEAPRRPGSRAIEAFAAGRRDDKRVLDTPGRLVFFCVLIRRVLWDQLGGLAAGYGTGNYEDDDFCLRARMAGYQLGVAPGAFVYHYVSRSFHLNRIDHAGLLHRNGLLFARRARELSAAGILVPNRRRCMRTTSVVVPFVDRSAGLGATLRSLAGQTLAGFEVVVGNGSGRPLDLSPDPGWAERLTLREVATGPSLATALNGALGSCSGEVIAYLPAGGVYYPFHLEVVLQHLESASVVCTGFARQYPARGDGGGEVSVAAFSLEIDETWVRPAFPLVAWAHHRRCLEAVPVFEPGSETPVWEWQLRMLSSYRPERHRYVTCDAGAELEERPSLDWLLEMYSRFPAWDGATGGSRHDVITAMQRGQPPDSGPPSKRPFERAIELARTLYRRAVPYESRLAVDHAARRLLGLPPATLQPASLAARVRGAEPPAGTRFPRHATGRDIIQFGANPWEDLFQRPQHFAALLGQRGHRVFYCGPEFHVASTPWWDGAPLANLTHGVLRVRLPALRSTLYGDNCLGEAEVEGMRLALEQVARSYAIHDPVCLVHVPQWMPLIGALQQRYSWPVVYDCLDDQDAFINTYGVCGTQDEERLVAACDVLVVTAFALRERWRSRRAGIRILPNACDYELFSAPPAWRRPLSVPEPVIGYYGTFSERMDLSLLTAVAEARPDWHFVFIGRPAFARRPEGWWALTRLANVHVLPPVEQLILAGYLSQFQVCLLPFHDNQMTRAMNFVKLYEFLAAGKPVVSARLREVLPLAEKGLVRIYHGVDGCIDQIEDALRQPAPVAAARRFASEHTWDVRVDVLEGILAGLSRRDHAR